MKNFIVGVLAGLVIATVGFSGLARMADKGVEVLKNQSQELAK